MFRNETSNYDPDELQYLGIAGFTLPCIKAIAGLFQCGKEIKKAWLLTFENVHAFILHSDENWLFVIKTGFRSGYWGEGPHGLAVALKILRQHDVEIKELEVNSDLLERLDKAHLTQIDLDRLASSKPVHPTRWHSYVFQYEDYFCSSKNWLNEYYPAELPFGLIDKRLFDLALRFSEEPDSAIISAYRRLEDIVRQRTSIVESSSKLFSKAFVVENSPLFWDLPDVAESKGRANLFCAVYTAFRNARAHRELSPSKREELREFLLLNELFLLESEAIER